jgi:IclR helix-turn-helix domain
MTEMTDAERQSGSAWNRQTRIAVGRALLSAHPEPMSAAELAAATSKDPSNVRRLADELVATGVLDAVDPPAGGQKGKGGRRPERLFAFAAGERDSFVDRFGEADGPGLKPGNQLVFVDISSLGEELVDCLSRPQLSRAKWAAVCDGTRQELVIAFEGEDAGEASLDLMAALATAKAAAARAVVSELCSGVELVRRFGRMGAAR